MKNERSCILVYNPISGHGHLDSWNAMFIAMLLNTGWCVLALTPDVNALTSRLEQRGVIDARNLHVLDWNALPRELSRESALALLRRLWRWWDTFGDRYCYRRAGSETTPDMSFLIYLRTRLFQKVVPLLFRASHFLYALYRRRHTIQEITNASAAPEAGYLDPAEFATRVRAALAKSPRKPVLVFNMYMDMYRTGSDSWNKFAAFNRYPWAGIRFVPSDLPRENYYSLPSLRGMCFLDENICRIYREKFPEKHFEYLPDITDTVLPSGSGTLAQEIRQRAAGRKIVFLGGSIGGQKNLARWYELVALADAKRWFFVQIGELHKGTFTPEDVVAHKSTLAAMPENLFVRAEYLPDERAFNEIISISDVIFAVYRDFRISSNMLGKAAAFEKPILVAEGYLMGQRVVRYGIGQVAPQDDTSAMLRALESLPEPATLRQNFERFRNDFGSDALCSKLTACFEHFIATH